ncbi:NAD(P)/FAD-dependent oxidoreductase [Paenibacillus ehimensis]|uniref:NADH:ubiquinone reductase (non-electrogenic) n=1 Tax=Paenibacillus ehimensis TaxID=79264 RepID=A0ABT8V8P4_9BACL|nr:FAD-dependent oxidoreductase [Paenibacillus ehimensis]MDO3676415.1 FAD-dependent oxidoreductase [Paenibacillus ehimensis]
MESKTIIVVGGGYAGLNAVRALQKQYARAKQQIRLILIDKEPYHLRKVLLFKAAVGEPELRVPFSCYFGDEVTIITAALTSVKASHRTIQVTYPDGTTRAMPYDRLVIALGSLVVSPPPEQGGIPLTSVAAAEQIRSELKRKVEQARLEREPSRQKSLLSVTVVGGGITGMEASAEIAYWLKREAEQAGLDPRLAGVHLVHSGKRLVDNAPAIVGRRAESRLNRIGVNVLYGVRGTKHADGVLHLSDGSRLPAGVCVWTLGLEPNPVLKQLGLPTEADGRLTVDAHYRVKGTRDIYAIGDGARILDPRTGQEDAMTCKEAIPQAQRLAKIIAADLEGKEGPKHRSFMPLYCIGLGPEDGLFWMRLWGMNLILSGKAGLFVRHATWDAASLIGGDIRHKLAVRRAAKAEI